jgi:hypothetical protein
LRNGGHHSARRLAERLDAQLEQRREAHDLDFGEDI